MWLELWQAIRRMNRKSPLSSTAYKYGLGNLRHLTGVERNADLQPLGLSEICIIPFYYEIGV